MNGKNLVISGNDQNTARYIFSDNGLDFHVKAKLLIPDKGPIPLNVFCMAQDKKGFLWFGSTHGLLKYDGYTMTIFKHNPDNPNSLSSNIVKSIIISNKGDLWVGTSHGLNRFIHERNQFKVFYPEDRDPKIPDYSSIEALYEDKNGYILTGSPAGLYEFNPKTGKFTLLNDSSSVRAIAENKPGNVWFGGNKGLFKYDRKTKKCSHFLPDPHGPDNINRNFIRSLLLDKKNVLWVGTTSGLLHLSEDPSGNYIFIRDTGSDNNLFISLDNRVWSIYEDKKGILWISSQTKLYRYDRNRDKKPKPVALQMDIAQQKDKRVPCAVFEDNAGNLWIATGIEVFKVEQRYPYVTRYITDPAVKDAMNRQINAIVECKNSILWIGTQNDGLIKFDRKRNKWTRFVVEQENSNSLSGNDITSMALDTSGYIWIGTYNGGLNRFDPQKRKWKHYQGDHIPDSLIDRGISSVCVGRDNTLWVGTWHGILNRHDRQKDTFTQFRHQPDNTNSIGKSSNIISILEDSFGMLWIGTEDGGLNMYDPGRNKFTHYLNKPGNSKSLSNNFVTHLFEDSNKMLWIGTREGLNRLDLNKVIVMHKNPVFTRYFTSKIIKGILEDDNGNIWISVGVLNYKFTRYNPETDEFTDFSYLFEPRSDLLCKSNLTGEFLVRSSKGFFSFNPMKIKASQVKPEVVLTDFQISNKSVTIAGSTGENERIETDAYQLGKSITETKNITLSYEERIFSFEFAALHFTDPAMNQYAYKMDDVDPDWVYTDASHRFATYTNLDPGEYIFKVKGSNSDGVWSDFPRELQITILPPWWKTNWAYSFYIFAILGLFLTFRRYELNRQKLKHSLELEHMEAKKLKEVDQLKSNFFTNISHEFRTPLTLINGPLSRLISIESDENKIRSLNIIKRNGDRLLCLINQLLDFSRLESGKMKLQTCKADIVSFVKGIMMSFQSLPEQKMITVKFTSDKEKVYLYFDREKAEKIFVNLLSNAFKFTPQGGRVEIVIKHPIQPPHDNGRRCLKITISNSGPGIPAEKLPHIFNRFYQADDSTTRNQEGTGIGLALSKELVELHHGTIQAESTVNQETKFTVTLLLGRDHLSADQIVEDESFHTNQDSKTTENTFLADSWESDVSTKSKLSSTVLIVEDNADMQAYIEEILDSNYKVKKAFDGQHGVEAARQNMPDLIISDLMMPKKDGYQLCSELKSDQVTSHIPIILLTAKAEKQDKLTGLELGADDYLIKPFDSEELLVRVKNLVAQRRLLREKFNKNISVEPRDITVSSVDETFMKKAFNLVEQNMDNSDFDTSLFAREIGMSRGHLNAKLKVLTGLSSRQFISSMRLKRAAKLLEQNHGNISEIAYKVGFNSLSHFSKIFKDTFGVLPSLYNIKVSSIADHSNV